MNRYCIGCLAIIDQIHKGQRRLYSEPHGSFFKNPHRYMERSGTTNNFFVGGFKNSCRLTDVNLDNLRTINQDLYILNSNLLFKTKNLEQACAQV